MLQTADIIIYKADKVPVGIDQASHIEISREIARRFNRLYGETFPEPQALLTDLPMIVGTDGSNKMSKSLDNHIELAAADEETTQRTMTMVTDPQRARRSDPGRPEVCNVFALQKVFNPDKTDEIHRLCTTAGIGCVDDKRDLAEGINRYLREFRERRRELSESPGPRAGDTARGGEARADRRERDGGGSLRPHGAAAGMTERLALPVAPDGSDALQVAVQVAQAASSEIERRLPDTIGAGAKERLGLTTKGGWNDRVTEVDKAAEDAALAVLTSAFPASRGRRRGVGRARRRLPVPLVRRPHRRHAELRERPSRTSASASAFGGTANRLAGVLLDPVRKETFTAAAGRGSSAERHAGDRCRMRAAWKRRCSDSTSATRGRRANCSWRAVAELWPGFQSVRMMGSAALGITYAGCGRLELYAHHYVQPWDIAAAIVVVREAGGVATELNGGPLDAGEQEHRRGRAAHPRPVHGSDGRIRRGAQARHEGVAKQRIPMLIQCMRLCVRM